MTTLTIAKDIVNIFRQSSITPYDTGNLRDRNIYAQKVDSTTSIVVLGGDKSDKRTGAPYVIPLEFANWTAFGNRNKHKGFIEKIFTRSILPYLEQLEIK